MCGMRVFSCVCAQACNVTDREDLEGVALAVSLLTLLSVVH